MTLIFHAENVSELVYSLLMSLAVFIP